MEDFVLDQKAFDEGAALGKNLIADALGPGASYSQFSPQPTSSAEDAPDEVHQVKTEIIDTARAKAGGEDLKAEATVKAPSPYDPIHDEKTVVTGQHGKK